MLSIGLVLVQSACRWLCHHQILQQSRQVIRVTCKMSGWMTSSSSMKGKWNSHRNIYSSWSKDRELSMLHRNPEVKILFLRYNTTLPSSAPVERLFSAGALVLTKRRNRLSDTLFESLVLLTLNKHLLWTVIYLVTAEMCHSSVFIWWWIHMVLQFIVLRYTIISFE